MNDIVLLPIDEAPESELHALRSKVFAGDEESTAVNTVLAAEAAVRPSGVNAEWPFPFGLAAFRHDKLVGWSEGYRQGRGQFFVNSSGVAPSERRKGIYSLLVKGIFEYAVSQGYVKVNSHHSASNQAVLIAKLRLGFYVSGFEYDEFSGPTVKLSYLVNDERRKLYQSRTRALRPAG